MLTILLFATGFTAQEQQLAVDSKIFRRVFSVLLTTFLQGYKYRFFNYLYAISIYEPYRIQNVLDLIYDKRNKISVPTALWQVYSANLLNSNFPSGYYSSSCANRGMSRKGRGEGIPESIVSSTSTEIGSQITVRRNYIQVCQPLWTET